MKKLVFIFAALFAMSLTSCFDKNPSDNQEGKQDTVQVAPVQGDTNQVAATDVTPAEPQEAASQEATEAVSKENAEVKDNSAKEEPQK